MKDERRLLVVSWGIRRRLAVKGASHNLALEGAHQRAPSVCSYKSKLVDVSQCGWIVVHARYSSIKLITKIKDERRTNWTRQWCALLTSAHWRQRQENLEFKVNLGSMARPCLKTSSYWRRERHFL